MNREIKFRAYDEHLKEMITPYLHLSDNGHFHAHDMTNTGNVVKPENVMQFTGLKDKNVVEIYEFDILVLPTNFKGVVRYKSGSFIIENDKGEFYYLSELVSHLSYQVIGNIYEHKHLLQ